MSCFSELTYSIFVDGELAAEEARRVESHLTECATCRDLVQALTIENRIVSAALAAPLAVDAPASVTVRGMAREFIAVVVVLATAGTALHWLAEALPANLDWLNPLTTDGRMNLFFSIVFYLRQGGPALLGDLTAAIPWLMLVLIVGAGLRLLWRRPPTLRSSICLVALLVAVALPGWGMSHRTGASVTVARDETVDDSLFASGEVVDIDGTVNGDLITGARDINIRGTVKGNLFAWNQHVEISGTVEGSVFSFAQILELRGGHVGHNLYAWSQFLRLEPGSRVEQDVVQGSQQSEINGAIGRNLLSYSGSADVRGQIGRDLDIRTRGVTLSAPAKVGGNVNAYVRHANDVRIGSGVTIGGKNETHITVRRSRLTRPSFYVWRIIGLLGAFVIGWLLLTFVPRFFTNTSRAVAAWGRSFGVGVAILIVTPVAAIILCITLIGMPLGIMTLFLYVMALYLAKIFVGAFLGMALLGEPQDGGSARLLALFLGLLVITVVTQVPYGIGVLFGTVVLCLGLGALGGQLYRELHVSRT
jgi:cytoskeletal protein CcmA (bactofilin family)